MSYIPHYLQKRDSSPLDDSQNRRNIFTSAPSAREDTRTASESKENSKPELPPDISAEELFPTLGNTTKVEVSNLNFASSLFNPEEKNDQIEKDIPDGWVRLQKNGEFVYGNKSEFAEQFEDFLEDMEESRVNRVLNRILDRYEEYEEYDLMVNGPKYMDGWEINKYIEELNAEAKLAARNYSSSEDTSDDEVYGNEFN
jgi:hypothetical protein